MCFYVRFYPLELFITKCNSARDLSQSFFLASTVHADGSINWDTTYIVILEKI